jgi:hypothetical protein
MDKVCPFKLVVHCDRCPGCWKQCCGQCAVHDTDKLTVVLRVQWCWKYMLALSVVLNAMLWSVRCPRHWQTGSSAACTVVLKVYDCGAESVCDHWCGADACHTLGTLTIHPPTTQKEYHVIIYDKTFKRSALYRK